jgi:AcrR family transcriptional regulator
MGRPRSFDQADTLDAICRQFHQTGYAATSLDDLMNATGLGKGSLYGAFGSKHEMYVRALTDYSEAALALFRDRLEGDDAGALARLKAYVREASTTAARSKNGCLVAKSIAELAGRDEDVDRIVAAFFKSMEDTIVKCIRQAQRSGDVPKSADARRIALLLVAVQRGMESLGKAGLSATSLRTIAEEALTRLEAA